jgi:MFS family permease
VASLSTPLRTTVALARPAERSAVPARRVLAVVSLGYLLASWAMNPVSAILPTITADLAIDVARAGWVMNAYFLLLVGWVLIAGRLGDAFGFGTVFRTGCLVFTAGSLLGALPGDYRLLLVGRAVQGLGSAMLFGTSLALVTTAYQGRRLGWAVGVLTVSSGASSIVGVWLNTTLIQYVDWHWTFVMPAVLGVLAAMLGRGLPAARRTRVSEVDWLGGGLLFGALVLLLLGLNHLHEGPESFEAGAPYHLSTHVASQIGRAHV